MTRMISHSSQTGRRSVRRACALPFAMACFIMLTDAASATATEVVSATAAEPLGDGAKVQQRWGEKIPMRDGVTLNGTLYLPRAKSSPNACLLTSTPYSSDRYHDNAVRFAARGYPVMVVDVRGRLNSGGEFRPLIQEAPDGYDMVEWLAKQPYCNGKVMMMGGSYGGYTQWAAAGQAPPHLVTIVPTAAPYAGVDFPSDYNIARPYQVQWHHLVNGRGVQLAQFGDDAYWNGVYLQWYKSGRPLTEIDQIAGVSLPLMRAQFDHPAQGDYWDRYNPTAAQYATITMPVLTITGAYDGDQPGAIANYRAHLANAPADAAARHYLVIGPWDHGGTRRPAKRIGGVTFGDASLVDIEGLHLEWFDHVLNGAEKPALLRDRVAYYVAGAERWRYAPTLEAVTAEARPYFLAASVNPTDIYRAGSLQSKAGAGQPDMYRYDPKDVSLGPIEARIGDGYLTDQTLLSAQSGNILVYQTNPFEVATEVSGFFKLSVWIGIDQPDTDFIATVYELRPDGTSIMLSSATMRARYRESMRTEKLVTTQTPLRYDFNSFLFASREIAPGSRLRLTIGPINSINYEKNYNNGGVVAASSVKDARTVTVRLFHDAKHPSALYVPVARKEVHVEGQ